MAGKKYKFDTSVTNATIASEKLNLNFNGYNRKGQKFNAYRVKSYKIQIDDLDVEEDGDLAFKMQLNYEDASEMDVISAKNEILTLSYTAQLVDAGTDAGTEERKEDKTAKLRQSGLEFLDGKDFSEVYIVEETFYVLLLNSGQDAIEVFHQVLTGNYVHLDPAEIKMRKEGITLT